MGKVLYGAVFMVLVPVALAAWAMALDRRCGQLGFESAWVGGALVALGVALAAWAMWNLRTRGGGLPMNAYPTTRVVSTGAYRLVPHPIYVGFVMAALGVSWAAGSFAGAWIVTPVAAMGCAALVWGYERDATAARIGRGERPLLFLPAPGEGYATIRERLSAMAAVFAPWLILYEAAGHLPTPDGIVVHLPFERAWPVLPWTEAVYASVYVFALAAPLLCMDRASLRRWAIVGVIGTWLGVLCYVCVPLVSPPRPIDASGFWAELVRWERSDGLEGRAACPSFHVFWACHTAWLISARWKRLAPLAWCWCVALMASCVTTGMHALVDLPAGVLLWAASMNARAIVHALARGAERLANAWRAWRVGPVRVINHGIFAGMAAAVGLWIVSALAGDGAGPWLLLVSAISMFGAAMWGQWWVGAPTSLRPFGYFGAILGGLAGLACFAAMGKLGWVHAGAFAVAAPWVQALGRCRCLVQGCCHGARTDAWWSIRCVNPMSRVCAASRMANTPIHPTPVYSMAGNVVIGLMLGRLWLAGAPATMALGAYFILAALLRFVEEHYRGEPHTPMRWGLRVYQWFSVVSVATGMAMMTVPSAPTPAPMWPGVIGWVVALAGGVLWAAGMGMDAPGCSWRFARLTGEREGPVQGRA